MKVFEIINLLDPKNPDLLEQYDSMKKNYRRLRIDLFLDLGSIDLWTKENKSYVSKINYVSNTILHNEKF